MCHLRKQETCLTDGRRNHERKLVLPEAKKRWLNVRKNGKILGFFGGIRLAGGGEESRAVMLGKAAKTSTPLCHSRIVKLRIT